MKIRVCEICNNPFDTNSMDKTVCNNCIKNNPSFQINEDDKKQDTKIPKSKENNSAIDNLILSLFG